VVALGYDAQVARLRFAKYHGLGNDFVLVEGPLLGADRARALCDRRRGIGADGLVTVLAPRTPGAAATMHIYNSDGSVAAMCGNAVRCVARHLADRHGLDGTLTIDTDSGPKICTLHRDVAGRVDAVSVEMGPAVLQGEQEFVVEGERHRAVRVSMGNPHAVLFEPPSRERALRLGPPIEAAVAGGVNVGFALAAGGAIDLVVWERGAGLTDACGTGACAAAVASVQAGTVPTDRPVEVRLPGGSLQITVAADLQRVTMRGPAERVFDGETEG
jgi:diaminopimelate epimerase